VKCRYSGPAHYDEAYAAAKTALGKAFWGPPKSGVYSPSVQYTLFQMGKLVLDRYGWAIFALHRCWFLPEAFLNFAKHSGCVAV
jgi:urate oxidase